MNRKGTVYMAADREGTLLYVGSSDDIIRRLGEHRRRSDWWDKRDWLGYADVSQLHVARLFEQKIIGEFGPEWNVHHKGKAEPRMPTDATFADMRAVESLLAEYLEHAQERLSAYRSSMTALEVLRSHEAETVGECSDRLRTSPHPEPKVPDSPPPPR